jgi:hypothetical protein
MRFRSNRKEFVSIKSNIERIPPQNLDSQEKEKKDHEVAARQHLRQQVWTTFCGGMTSEA